MASGCLNGSRKRRLPMSAPVPAAPAMSLPASAAAPRFNSLPFAIALFCLLWSFAFIAGKIGVTDCPPLILLAARFSLAGVLILGFFVFRREAWKQIGWREASMFAILGIA